jgi:NADH:ubiquinone reductase (H+-translocating)
MSQQIEYQSSQKRQDSEVSSPQHPHHVVIIGGGFGGLYAAKTLAKAPVKVTLIDKRNFHLFQPLLYQVATGGLSPNNISSPLRSLLKHHKNIEVLMSEVIQIDAQKQTVKMHYREISYDSLIVATGATHQYFNNNKWADKAPGLKTVEDALEIRRRILIAFEAAEKEVNPERRKAWLTFVMVGGGAAGVELAGAIAELAHNTLKEDFRNINPSETKVVLIQSPDRLLPTYAPELSDKAKASLENLGVNVWTGTRVIDIENNLISVRKGEDIEQIQTRNVFWTAGMKGSGLAKVLATSAGAELDKTGRVVVTPNFNVGEYENIYAIGDLVNYSNRDGKPLPGVAPAAMQQGQYVARLIESQIKGKSIPPFQYFDWGSMATIGKHAAVADFGFLKLSGFIAWIFWMFIHVFYLLEFDNKVIVTIQWAWNYFTSHRGARLITAPGEQPTVKLEEESESKGDRGFARAHS